MRSKIYRIPSIARIIILTVFCSLLPAVMASAKKKGPALPVIRFVEAPDTFRLTDNFRSIRCMQLGSKRDSVMGIVSRIIEADGYLIVLAETSPDSFTNEVSLFDREDGRLIRQIGRRGDGPEEYRRANDISYNPEDKTVMILDRVASEFVSYRLDGEFVGKRRSNEDFYHAMTSMERASDGTMLICKALESGIGDQGAFLIINHDWTEEEIDPFYPVVVPQVGMISTSFHWAKIPMSSCGDELKFVGFLSDTLFSVKGGKATPLYKLDFGMKRLTKKFINKIGSGSLLDLSAPAYAVQNRIFSYVEYMFETSRYLVILPMYQAYIGSFWIDKHTGEGLYVPASYLSDKKEFGYKEYRKIAEGKTIFNIMGSNENSIITCFESSEKHGRYFFNKAFAENREAIVYPDSVVEAIGNVDPEGNPFLIIYEH